MHKLWGQAVDFGRTSCVYVGRVVNIARFGCVHACAQTCVCASFVTRTCPYFSTSILGVIKETASYFSTLSTPLIITTTSYITR
jgi:hypothetical protein